MQEIDFSQFTFFPEDLSDLGSHGQHVESALQSVYKIADSFFPNKKENKFAKRASLHTLRLFLTCEMLVRKVKVTNSALKIIFSVFSQELEFLLQQKGTESSQVSHYHLLQEVASIKAKQYSSPVGDEEPENPKEIGTALEIHSKFVSITFGKKAGEFAREIDLVEKAVRSWEK